MDVQSELHARERLLSVLRRLDPTVAAKSGDGQPDLTARIPGLGEVHIELKMLPDAQPLRLRTWLTHHPVPAAPGRYLVLGAPWMSERAMDVCEAAGVGALDLTGNYRLTLGTSFLERVGNAPPPAEQRALKNLYVGKALQVVRTLLAAPAHRWQVQTLAEASGVSLGTASSVRTRLREAGWFSVEDGTLSDPEGLLREWAQWGTDKPAPVLEAYTTLHGTRLSAALHHALPGAPPAILAGVSAAAWMAPFLTAGQTELYADPRGWQTLATQLEAEEVGKGGNLRVTLPADPGVFLDRLEVKPGLWTASPAQTYVDLWRQGNRGREAAEKLLSGYLRPLWAGGHPYASWPLRDRAGQA